MTEPFDPQAEYEEIMRAHRAEKRDQLSYGDWCKACAAVLATEAGQRMLAGADALAAPTGGVFSVEDNYNSHAAAQRDGGRVMLARIREASSRAAKKTDQ